MRDRVLDDVADAPERITAGDLAHEALEQTCALPGMGDLGMKLHAVEAAPLIRHGRVRNGAGRGGRAEAGGQSVDPVTVTHPDVELRASRAVAPVLETIEQP